MEDQRRHAATSQNGCRKAWSESRGTHGIALNGEDWYDVRHGRLIITPDGTAKEDGSHCCEINLIKAETSLYKMFYFSVNPKLKRFTIFYGRLY